MHDTGKLTPDERVSLVLKWAGWFYEHTESYGNREHRHPVGISLAYLWPAMLKGDQIEVTEEYEIVQILKANNIPEDDILWAYIDVVEEEYVEIEEAPLGLPPNCHATPEKVPEGYPLDQGVGAKFDPSAALRRNEQMKDLATRFPVTTDLKEAARLLQEGRSVGIDLTKMTPEERREYDKGILFGLRYGAKVNPGQETVKERLSRIENAAHLPRHVRQAARIARIYGTSGLEVMDQLLGEKALGNLEMKDKLVGNVDLPATGKCDTYEVFDKAGAREMEHQVEKEIYLFKGKPKLFSISIVPESPLLDPMCRIDWSKAKEQGEQLKDLAKNTGIPVMTSQTRPSTLTGRLSSQEGDSNLPKCRHGNAGGCFLCQSDQAMHIQGAMSQASLDAMREIQDTLPEVKVAMLHDEMTIESPEAKLEAVRAILKKHFDKPFEKEISFDIETMGQEQWPHIKETMEQGIPRGALSTIVFARPFRVPNPFSDAMRMYQAMQKGQSVLLTTVEMDEEEMKRRAESIFVTGIRVHKEEQKIDAVLGEIEETIKQKKSFDRMFIIDCLGKMSEEDRKKTLAKLPADFLDESKPLPQMERANPLYDEEEEIKRGWDHFGGPFEIQALDISTRFTGEDRNEQAVLAHRVECGCEWPEVDYQDAMCSWLENIPNEGMVPMVVALDRIVKNRTDLGDCLDYALQTCKEAIDQVVSQVHASPERETTLLQLKPVEEMLTTLVEQQKAGTLNRHQFSDAAYFYHCNSCDKPFIPDEEPATRRVPILCHACQKKSVTLEEATQALDRAEAAGTVLALRDCYQCGKKTMAPTGETPPLCPKCKG